MPLLLRESSRLTDKALFPSYGSESADNPWIGAGGEEVSASPSETPFTRMAWLTNVRGEVVPPLDAFQGNPRLCAKPLHHVFICACLVDCGLRVSCRYAEVIEEYTVDTVRAAESDLVVGRKGACEMETALVDETGQPNAPGKDLTRSAKRDHGQELYGWVRRFCLMQKGFPRWSEYLDFLRRHDDLYTVFDVGGNGVGVAGA